MESLAIKYRPKTWTDVVEQSATKVILQQQLNSGEIKNAYLFCGGAGTGKTTCARIFASEINNHRGVPIELDAASNNSVDDVRQIITESKTASLDSEYKVFIMDEVHALSNNAWQAMLKILEEPPKKSIFIMCTTDPQKIPKTILSRVQRYDFQRISQEGVVYRLKQIVQMEGYSFRLEKVRTYLDALEYIAKLADGGMRDALTMLDKCLAYNNELTLSNVTEALGRADYSTLMDFVNAYIDRDISTGIKLINDVYMSGKDLKQFMKQVMEFVLDVYKFQLDRSMEYLSCPETEELHKFMGAQTWATYENNTLSSIIKLNADIKWETNPKARIESWFITGE